VAPQIAHVLQQSIDAHRKNIDGKKKTSLGTRPIIHVDVFAVHGKLFSIHGENLIVLWKNLRMDEKVSPILCEEMGHLWAARTNDGQVGSQDAKVSNVNGKNRRHDVRAATKGGQDKTLHGRGFFVNGEKLVHN
jgi:hypothetical protein